MPQDLSGAARTEVRTLIRNARQLVTLRGPGGPRGGPAMNEIGIIANGALMISNGAIEEVGPTKRLENLATARGAREIDAGGRIVMPAFVEPYGTLGASWIEGKDDAAALRVSSRRSIEFRTAVMAAERARYGCIAIGSATPVTNDLRSVFRLLKAQRSLQQKPLRIRSIVAWRDGVTGAMEELHRKWLPALRRQKLASMIELIVESGESRESGDSPEQHAALREAAMTAASAGFGVSLRSDSPLPPGALMLALSAGAISIVSPLRAEHAFNRPLTDIGCVRVVPLAMGIGETETVGDVRDGIDSGAAVALTSPRTSAAAFSVNPQYLIHVAMERYGLTAAEALTALTHNAACALRMGHVTGSLDCGRPADLILMDAPDYRELARRPGNNDVSLLMRGGRVVWQKSALIPD